MEVRLLERGIGCASVIPAAYVGVAGLADYAGPRGLRGASEFLGWAAICFAAGLGVALLLTQFRQSDWRRFAAVPVAVAAVGAFTYLPHWLGLDAPGPARWAFTTLLQITGSLARIALLITAIYVGARQRY
jgi:hypothetical protein